MRNYITEVRIQQKNLLDIFYILIIGDLQERYSEGKLGDLSKVSHTLKMCNSSYFDQNLQAQKLIDGKQRTSSFDLNLFRVKPILGRRNWI